MNFAYYSHHKCATGWTNSILRELCFHTGHAFKVLHGIGGKSQFAGIGTFINKNGIDFLSYTNANPDYVVDAPSHKGFHVIRDPRDLIVSAYHSHLYTHSLDNGWNNIESQREKLKALSKEQGMIEAIRFAEGTLRQMIEWDYQQDHILEIKMEELTASPPEEFEQILSHLGLPVRASGYLSNLIQRVNRLCYALNHRAQGHIVPSYIRKEDHVHAQIFDKIMTYHEFEKVKKRDLRRRDGEKSHYRKGKSGDWRDHFTDRVANAFDQEYGGIVSKLGYD